ncbi:bifunctional ADP-dependent NAD(P)H-hydrate dehydratase/NAD(P)H-hydrate epimerase [Rhodobacter ferrooxidans]|uniref:Bifunctional NAD(P)H-hydrate repair enzyme n=1 Tax=Rhodobacter ferrooxidans TaxID=371731 RepID=C8S2P9_9RHOB|nr:bifunctional ADP-dependent NAD(P)H-hydrate dehydratase/NAD(P)H-hydrate epimerase [Rhodobacter sp. SW2]EEW24725.1 carbohydrate kinase, YjeF related protein [Rhodobacter sp. SW2]
MTELLTAAQMRALERAAIDSGRVTGLELMERAGRGVVEAIFHEWPELRATSQRAVVLCGPGNNGGDGFVVARLLKDWGWQVEVLLFGDPSKLPPDARANHERWCGMGQVTAFHARDSWQEVLDRFPQARDQILIDALFGTGLARRLEDPVRNLLRHLDDTLDLCVGRYVAVDVPSGVCADSGKGLSDWLRKADLTVTFHRAKVGHFLDWAPYYAGRLVVVDIGLTGAKAGRGKTVHLVQDGHPLLNKKHGFHKYHYGHALLLAGGPGRGGAARLAARGALRIGAGLVTLGCLPEAMAENAARLDAVMLRTVADAAALEGVLEDKRINALCLGPGLGVSDETRALAAQGLKSGRALVLDADALTLIARDASLFAGLHAGCVLTPHGGEFARLFPDIAARLDAVAETGPAYSKVDATREAAARAGCVVLFKGPDTVIAAPDGRCSIHSAAYDRAAPWLATAGAGDVLAGFITGLLARGFAPFDAACTAAFLHVECARSFGPGLIAEDLPDELPKVLRGLGLLEPAKTATASL